MFNIAKEFAPPFKLIVPYFIMGMIFYALCMGTLFLFDAASLTYEHIYIKAWVHLFLVGFVIFIIVGAMAQLIPVVLEIGHYHVELFYVIFPFLVLGLVFLLSGFIADPTMLPYGGVLLLLAFGLYLFNLLMTLKEVKKLTLVVKSVAVANAFLAIGLIFGLLMALNYAGIIVIDMSAFLKAHVYLLICGYITLTVMGISLVLVPMFGLSHGFNDQSIVLSIYLLATSVVIVVVASIFELSFFEYFGYFTTVVAYVLYVYQIAIIYKNRARKESDIWAKSMIFAFVMLVISLGFIVAYFIKPNQAYLLVSGFLFFVGFLGFIITAHLYKIVPFLVWFHRFSPLVGKQKVPMMADMVPKKSAHYQFVFSTFGTLLCAVALLFGQDVMLKMGASFLVVGTMFLLGSLYYMLSFKGK
ncbi:MAG: hypothetical protein CVU67_03660 [Deltaproteobacteria bacterium HGW-Deltaproteobacteria-24]|jgi:hypothetical protein|nr:MAG: hypothetical protein CVU67_03660 [Deltaproteobacteria bacterium HGW-Deltaproteobacteria-24]